MTTSQVQKLATVGQVVLGGVILALQVVALARSRAVKAHVGSEASS